MPKFTRLDPKGVTLGKSRAAARAREPYVEMIRSSQAGKIELEEDERPSTVKRRLRDAARELNVKVRSSWEDERQRVLYWKRLDGSD